MKVSVVVSKGIDKKTCEDAVLLGDTVLSECELELELELPTTICVADGVGGNLGGELASGFVLNKIKEKQYIEIDEVNLKQYFLDLNNNLLEYANTTEVKKNMATTLTGIFADEIGMYYAHAGNTRLYIMQGEYLKQITKEHTTYQWLLDHGNEEAASLCNKNEIRCCFGGGSARYINELEVGRVENWSRISTLLMTSDGIHEYVDIDTLEEVLISDKSDIEIAKQLIFLATQNGSCDDKSVIVIRR